MAIVLVSRGTTDYICLDADVNPGPTTATYPIGVTAWAYDTNKIYRTNNGTNWTFLKSGADLAVIATGTFTTSSATVPADTGRTEATGYFNGCLLVPLTGADANQPRIISTFTATSGVFAMDTAFTAATGLVTYNILANQVPASVALIKTQTDKTPKMEFTPVPDWSESQLTVTIPATAGTLTLPSVVMAALPVGATITRARAILTSRIIYNTNAAANKLNGATVAATSQVIQIKKDAGAWVDAINFIDDQFSQAGLVSEGGVFIPGSMNLAATVTGNGTYTFQWLLARADQDAIVMQGVKMAIQVSYTL